MPILVLGPHGHVERAGCTDHLEHQWRQHVLERRQYAQLLGGGDPGRRQSADTFIITGAQAFSLHGGAGNDSFLFNNGASLTGSLDGGSGTDTLDFSAYATARSVILTGADATGFSGTQPAISGGITGIDVLVGSAATNDNLTGTNAASTWTIGAADTYRTGTATLDFLRL